MNQFLTAAGAILLRTIRILIPSLVAATLIVLSPSVQAQEPERSGTIVSGTGATGTSPGWGMDGCVGAPSCRAWFVSGCDARLAGQDPAPMTSIVDIEDVVDANPDRILDVQDGEGLNWGHFRVQFWTETGHPGGQGPCKEIAEGRFNSWDCGLARGHAGCALTIPHHAKWMTITSSPDNTNIHWTLT